MNRERRIARKARLYDYIDDEYLDDDICGRLKNFSYLSNYSDISVHGQTVHIQVRLLLKSSLIRVCTVCQQL